MSRYEPIDIEKGEGLDHHLVYTDDDGEVVDISMALAVSIYEAFPEALADLITPTITLQEDNGVLEWGVLVEMDAADAWPTPDTGLLKEGNLQWFRVALTYEGGVLDVSEEQWINVR